MYSKVELNYECDLENYIDGDVERFTIREVMSLYKEQLV